MSFTEIHPYDQIVNKKSSSVYYSKYMQKKWDFSWYTAIEHKSHKNAIIKDLCAFNDIYSLSNQKQNLIKLADVNLVRINDTHVW